MGIGPKFNKEMESKTPSSFEEHRAAYRALIAKFEDLGVNDKLIYPVAVYTKDGTKAPIRGKFTGFGTIPGLNGNRISDATNHDIDKLNLIFLYIDFAPINITDIDIDKMIVFTPIERNEINKSNKEVEQVEARASVYAKEISEEEKGEILDEFMKEARKNFYNKLVETEITEQGIGNDSNLIYTLAVYTADGGDPLIVDFWKRDENTITLTGVRKLNTSIRKIVLVGTTEKTDWEKKNRITS